MRTPILCSLLFACTLQGHAAPAGTHAKLAILETTDLHAAVLGYDYFKLQADPSIGLERTATLIAAARREWPNTLLLDNGDTIQGNALADFQAVEKPVACGERLAIYKAMNMLGYEAGTIGNHEFNYGLPFLAQVTGTSKAHCAGPNFPLVLANLVDAQTGQPVFEPYRIIEKTLRAQGPDGKSIDVPVKIGVIGFTPAPVISWDKRWLEGKVRALGMKETAQRYLPEMRAKGADLVVVLSHAGLSDEPYAADQENPNVGLSEVPGIDALLMGHMHLNFPEANSKLRAFNQPAVDKVNGRVNGVPAVMPGNWGKGLGLVEMSLQFNGKHWSVDKSATRVEVRGIQGVTPDPRFADAIKAEHAATIAYVRTPIGETGFRMSSQLADLGDVSAIEVVNLAQADYVSRYVQANLPQYAKLPVLAISAPFKTGAAGPSDYTDVAPGPIAINNAADLYLYPNLLYAVKVNGNELRAWLEKGAERFNTIDPNKTEAQALINPNSYGFNFDMLTDARVSYEIDVSRAAGQRVRELRYQGQPVTAQMEFIVATNSYRATGGGNFPGLDGSKTILASPDTSRDVLIEYIKRVKHLQRADHGAHCSWRFTRFAQHPKITVQAGAGAEELARVAGLNYLHLVQPARTASEFQLFEVDLSR